MALASILLIESGRPSAPSFASALEKKGFAVQVCHKVPTAVAQARKNAPDVLVLDAASMRTSGTRMCRSARSSLDGIPIILISPEGSEPDPGNGSTVNLVLPFRPIKLNLAQRKVRVRGREGRLTPKQAKLLELFLNNPGKLLTRERLIHEVWLTDYTGDTRTLDVHMSWLRQAIEANPKRPTFLKTIRGLGYR